MHHLACSQSLNATEISGCVPWTPLSQIHSRSNGRVYNRAIFRNGGLVPVTLEKSPAFPQLFGYVSDKGGAWLVAVLKTS